MVEEMESANHAGQEGRNEIVQGARVLDRPCYQILNAPDLHLYVEEGTAAVTVQNLFQQGWCLCGRPDGLMELRQRVATDHQAVELGIMAED